MEKSLIILLAALLTTLAAADDAAAGRYLDLRPSGTINDRRIVEASGLARSHLVSDRLWTMNDRGSDPELFALGGDGTVHGSVSIGRARNVDWEDLASFEHEGKAWLLVADIGDNNSQRRFYSLYLVEEPQEPRGQKIVPDREIRFRYADGPLDAESIAVDVADQLVLILVKRTVPARLYSLPLFAAVGKSVQIAEYRTQLDSLPQPTRREKARALADRSWHWQPTAMDISRNGDLAAILTYRGVYIYARSEIESWVDALQKSPQTLAFDSQGIAEAIAFNFDDSSLFITVEGRSPPVYRSDRQ